MLVVRGNKLADFSDNDISNEKFNSNVLGLDPEIRMRCPKCYKLYSVDPKTIYVDKPEFDCISCEQKFWISFPEALEHSEIVAFPIEWSEQYESEIGSDELLQIEETEMLSPDLVEKISKHFSEPLEEETVRETETTSGMRKVGFVDDVESELTSEYWFLEKSWDKVLNNYDDKSVHKEFIHSARAKQSLDFALSKYSNFCEANSKDSVALDMKTYCEKLIQDHAIHMSVLGNTPVGLKKYTKFLPWLVLSLAALFIGVGLSNEDLAWFAGVGFALIFITGALSLLKESDL